MLVPRTSPESFQGQPDQKVCVYAPVSCLMQGVKTCSLNFEGVALSNITEQVVVSNSPLSSRGLHRNQGYGHVGQCGKTLDTAEAHSWGTRLQHSGVACLSSGLLCLTLPALSISLCLICMITNSCTFILFLFLIFLHLSLYLSIYLSIYIYIYIWEPRPNSPTFFRPKTLSPPYPA